MAVLTIRAGKRYAVRRAVSVRCPNGDQEMGLLIELSQDGGRISGLGEWSFAAGDAVLLEVDDRVMPSAVRWASPGVIGVRFEKALYPAELSALLIHREPQGNAQAGLAA